MEIIILHSEDEKTMEVLKKRLNELGYHPTIAHEYVTEDRVWHSYFSITTDGVIG